MRRKDEAVEVDESEGRGVSRQPNRRPSRPPWKMDESLWGARGRPISAVEGADVESFGRLHQLLLDEDEQVGWPGDTRRL